MAQSSYSRQLLVFAVPTIAILLSYLWYKRKRSTTRKQTDPGETDVVDAREESKSAPVQQQCSAAVDTPQKGGAQKDNKSPFGSPESKSPRILSTPSTPIDIVVPRELRSQKSMPIVISDEDLDLEIEKIKSMRSYSVEKSLPKMSADDSPLSHKSYSSKKKLNTTMSTPDKSEASPIKLKTPQKKSDKKRPSSAASSTKVDKVEDKLNKLNLDNNKASSDVIEDKPQTADDTTANDASDGEATPTPDQELQADERHPSMERDSANHSPAATTGSPALSCLSDSEGSSDSGKGCSDVATPPSHTPPTLVPSPVHPDPQITQYEFTLPQGLVGKLIGKYGNFVAGIKEKTDAYVVVKKHPTTNKCKLCVIEGTQEAIEAALKIIRDRFPLRRHPEVTLEQVGPTWTSIPVSSEYVYCKLVEGINNDTLVSCMVTPIHFFLHQPAHPTYPHLQLLIRAMSMFYTTADAPGLPKPILANTVCIAYTDGFWHRVMILTSDPVSDTSYVTFLDGGGYGTLPNEQLKQIRGDFLLLPFQAAECLLYNVKAVGGEGAGWSDEAFSYVGDLVSGTLMQTQIADYTEEGIPLVLVYLLVGQDIVFLNDELVIQGFAEYIEPPVQYCPRQLVNSRAAYESESMDAAVGGVGL